MALAGRWDSLSHREKQHLRKIHATHGFKRHSVTMKWEKFDMAESFCLDVMHQMDEGVVRYIVQLIVELDPLFRLTTADISEIDRRWINIQPPGNENRNPRSIREYKSWKAHELRFFLHHGLPYVTEGILPDKFCDIFCLASNIGRTSTQDEITEAELEGLKDACRRFMVCFEAVFGVTEMKYSVHLVWHIWFAVTLYGPLGNVSCYGPEDQIGKIARKIKSSHNTAKHVMDTFTTMTKCGMLVEAIIDNPRNSDRKVIKVAERILGRKNSVFQQSNIFGLFVHFNYYLINSEDLVIFLRLY